MTAELRSEWLHWGAKKSIQENDKTDTTDAITTSGTSVSSVGSSHGFTSEWLNWQKNSEAPIQGTDKTDRSTSARPSVLSGLHSYKFHTHLPLMGLAPLVPQRVLYRDKRGQLMTGTPWKIRMRSASGLWTVIG